VQPRILLPVEEILVKPMQLPGKVDRTVARLNKRETKRPGRTERAALLFDGDALPIIADGLSSVSSVWK
jgi:hypothetical protein